MKDLKGKSNMFIAALAVKENSAEIIERGITKMFNSNAIEDYRDIIRVLVLYYDAAERIGLNPDRYFESYMNNHIDKKQHLEPFIKRSKEDKLLKAGGYKVIYNPDFNYIES